ncbi:Ribosomal protein L1/ribosomal biogenesis protein [Dillenia turbinata]|uniref:Ribosomal protein L1/ribosomal biogenesis protein n=1 Tax=Dillenia turbinata TaxID=194707 RepID=A0AAN8ZSU3_9MAGN
MAKSQSRVSRETIERAVNSLLKWNSAKSESEKPKLLEEDDFVYLVLTLKKIPAQPRTNPFKIPLPHSLHTPSASLSGLCLIIDDRPKSKITSEITKKKIKSEDIPVSKVLKLSKLKSDYKPFEAKRKLCDSYDLFLADKGIVPLLPKLLGKKFFKKKKIPISVDLTHNNWKEQIERACGSALLFMNTGTCCSVKIGRVSMSKEEIVENAVAAIDGAAEVVPKQWGGLRSIHLKLFESLALPLYLVLPDMKLKIEGAKENVNEQIDGEMNAKKSNENKKKVSKKGRIHEVHYMDDIVADELAIVSELEDDVANEVIEVETKKRKKSGLAKDSNKDEGNGKRKAEESDEKSDEKKQVPKKAKSDDEEIEVKNKKKKGSGLAKGSNKDEGNGKRKTEESDEKSDKKKQVPNKAKSDDEEIEVKNKKKKGNGLAKGSNKDEGNGERKTEESDVKSDKKKQVPKKAKSDGEEIEAKNKKKKGSGLVKIGEKKKSEKPVEKKKKKKDSVVEEKKEMKDRLIAISNDLLDNVNGPGTVQLVKLRQDRESKI